MKVHFEDISVVVQGAIGKNIDYTLESIRKHLPGATIILSTWENSNIEGLDYDIAIQSKDPGAFPCDKKDDSIMNNVNRQIVSTLEGLKRCKTQYAIKLRSDFYFTGNAFIDYFGVEKEFDREYKFLKNRVVACTLYSRNPRSSIKTLRMPYCPSDFFYFGYTEDLLDIFSVKLIDTIEDKMYFDLYPEETAKLNYKLALCRFMPEQTIWMGFLSKYIKELNCTCRDDINSKNIILTEQTVVNNLTLYSYEDLNINTFNETLFTKGIPENCFLREDWEELYKYYCKGGSTKQFNRYIKKVYRRKQKRNNYSKDENSSFEFMTIENFAELNKWLDDCKYVSFDIFDTLIYRTTSPDWQAMAQTGEFASMLLSSDGHMISADRFNRLRDYFADIRGRENKSKGKSYEYNLREVVRDILLFIGICEEKNRQYTELIYRNEVLREQELTFVNPDAEKVLKDIYEKGVHIIAVSDMYLGYDALAEIIEKKGIQKYISKIYVSSEYGMLKSDGKLFEYVLKDQNISKDMIVHVGDNIESDIKGANTAGIRALYYLDRKNQERKNKIERQVLGNTEIEFVNQAFSSLAPLKTFDDYIKEFFSYDFINFVYDFTEKIYKNAVDAIFFLERDGVLFQPIYKKIVDEVLLFYGLKKIPDYTIKISRKDSACLININSIDDVIERSKRVNPPERMHILHILGCFGISINDFEIDLQKEIIEHNSDIRFFVENYTKYFLPIIAKRRKKVLDELNSKGVFGYSNIAIIDIGWGGTTQGDLQKYINNNQLPVKLFGYYYACDDRAQTLVPYYSQYNYGPDLFFGYSLIEFLVKNYKADQEPHMQETYKYNLASRNAIISSTDIFIKTVNKYSLTPEMIRRYTFNKLRKFINNPPLDFLKIIDKVVFSLDRHKNDSYINLFSKINTIRELDTQYKNAQWVQASLKVSNKDFIKYVSKKNKYDFIRQKVILPNGIKRILLKFIRYWRSRNAFEN